MDKNHQKLYLHYLDSMARAVRDLLNVGDEWGAREQERVYYFAAERMGWE